MSMDSSFSLSSFCLSSRRVWICCALLLIFYNQQLSLPCRTLSSQVLSSYSVWYFLKVGIQDLSQSTNALAPCLMRQLMAISMFRFFLASSRSYLKTLIRSMARSTISWKDSRSKVSAASQLSLLVGMISSAERTTSSMSFLAGVRWSEMIFLVAFQTLLAAFLNHMLYYKDGNQGGGEPGGIMTQLTTSPKMIMTRFMRYCTIDVPFFLRQKVERMKKIEIQMTSLLRMNMPTEHSVREMKLAPSASSPAIRRVGSYILIFVLLFLLINNISINQSINQSIHQSIHQSINPSINQSINQSITIWLGKERRGSKQRNHSFFLARCLISCSQNSMTFSGQRALRMSSYMQAILPSYISTLPILFSLDYSQFSHRMREISVSRGNFQLFFYYYIPRDGLGRSSSSRLTFGSLSSLCYLGYLGYLCYLCYLGYLAVSLRSLCSLPSLSSLIAKAEDSLRPQQGLQLWWLCMSSETSSRRVLSSFSFSSVSQSAFMGLILPLV